MGVGGLFCHTLVGGRLLFVFHMFPLHKLESFRLVSTVWTVPEGLGAEKPPRSQTARHTPSGACPAQEGGGSRSGAKAALGLLGDRHSVYSLPPGQDRKPEGTPHLGPQARLEQTPPACWRCHRDQGDGGPQTRS